MMCLNAHSGNKVGNRIRVVMPFRLSFRATGGCAGGEFVPEETAEAPAGSQRPGCRRGR